MEKHIDISVIVPIYNVEEYLVECLDSIATQTKKNIEVIMIDDGSTDNSGSIADDYSKKYSNFYCYHIENQGLGHARNYGVSLAKGKYISFIDSDDIIVNNIYQLMFDLAEKNNSEITSCNVERFNSTKHWASGIHTKAFKNIEEKTNIFDNNNIIYDTISPNKLFLKSFWEKNNIKFPEGILYEDIPVIIPLYCIANSVSIIKKFGYLWRARDGATSSITQNTQNMQNLYDRLSVMKMVDEFFEKNITDESLIDAKQIKFLEVDLNIFVSVCNKVSKEQAYEIMNNIREYMKSHINYDVLKKISVINQQKYEFILKNDLDGLVNVLNNQNVDYYNAPIEEKDGEFYIECSDDIFPIKERNVTLEMKKTIPKRYINDIKISDKKVKIFAHLYIPRLNISTFEEQKIEAFLYNENSKALVPLKVVGREDKNLTKVKGFVYNPNNGVSKNYNYNGTGFNVIIDLDDIEISNDLLGDNRVLIKYENRVSKGEIYLGSASPSTINKIKDSSVLKNDNLLRMDFDLTNDFIIKLSVKDNFVESVAFNDNQINIVLEKKAKSIFAVNQLNQFRILFKTDDMLNFSAKSNLFDVDNTYYFFIENIDGTTDKLFSRNKSISVENLKNQAVIVRTNKSYKLNIYYSDLVNCVVDYYKKYSFVFLKVECFGNIEIVKKVKKAMVVIDDILAEKKVILSSSKCKIKNNSLISKFIINFLNKKLVSDLYTSTRDVYIEYELSTGEIIRRPLYTSNYFKFISKVYDLRWSLYRFNSGSVKLNIQQKWNKFESSAAKRKALVNKYYPKFRKMPINSKKIIFESMWGDHYSCNVRYLYEYIDKNHPEYKCVWSLKDSHKPINGNGIRVRRGSLKYFYHLATSKYFVNNVNFEDAYVKRKGQIEIQTMHGTPLKVFGLDIKDEFKTNKSKEDYIRRNSRWNYLVVQGDFMANKAYQCFKYSGKILKTGYPRTDLLLKGSKDKEKIKKIKEKLNLPLDKKVILYTPTWRIKNNFEMKLNIENMRKKLSDDYILLIRLHYFSGDSLEVKENDNFVYNMNKYNSVEELYMISDILITDYSSVMFDYSLLKKPMIFFLYDLDEYANNLRGTYVDIEKEAPGIIAYTSEEVINSILNIDSEIIKCQKRIDMFNNKYTNYECSKSCEKIFNEIFE